MRSRLQIRVLGELRVARDGKSLPLPASKKTRALLAYLAVVARPVRRDHLCELFWEIPDDPRASLRWSLHKIRKITRGGGQECLVADSSRVFLDPQTIELDFMRVSRLRPNEIEMLDTTALESLAGAFEGEFLEDLRLPHCPKFEDWRLYQANSVTRTRVQILRALIDRTREQPERTLFYAHSLRSLNPEREAISQEVRELVSAPDRILATPSALAVFGSAHRTRRDDGVQDEMSGSRGSDDADLRPPGDAARLRRSQDIRFCRSRDGVQIAYAVCGHGPPLVRAAHWMSHLEYDWESPVWRHWIDALSRRNTLIRYDQRGNGLSDREVADFSFEAMVDDLESVVDAAHLDQFTLLGVSQSCSVSVAYAARHPERLTGLILYGGFVKGWRKRGDPHEITTHEAMTTLIREGWGKNNPTFRQLFTTMFIPGANLEQIVWFNELQRIAVSSEDAGRLHEAFGEIDVSAVLAGIAIPTLVLHARHDLVVPFHSGREFATGIRGARFVDLDSANHILLADEPAFFKFCEEVTRFISESASR
jgi:pimeloyl-ACP methyl ester carboxylesterase/DNA-binding SARP family transcriptional activator